MPDRTANWGESQSAAKYQTGDSDPTGGDFIVARKADGSAELLVWNDTAGQWESGGPVDMGGNDITNAGAISAAALEADEQIGRDGLSIERQQSTSGVSTSAVSIYDVTGNGNGSFGTLQVGSKGGGGDEWRDLIFWSDTGVTLVAERSAGGAPTRSYSYDGNDVAVKLALGSGTQDVEVTATESRTLADI